MDAKLIVTAARDAIHVEGTAGVSPVFGGPRGGLITNGHPGTTVCGQTAAVGVNRYAADQLYPSLSDCPTCFA